MCDSGYMTQEEASVIDIKKFKSFCKSSICQRGFMPIEGNEGTAQLGISLRNIPLIRNGKRIKRNYCAFWKADNANIHVLNFAEILKSKFKV